VKTRSKLAEKLMQETGEPPRPSLPPVPPPSARSAADDANVEKERQMWARYDPTAGEREARILRNAKAKARQAKKTER
jgi:hypothetical protein